MKILFDLTPIYDHLSGIERYNINITKEIIRQHPEDKYILLFKNEVHNEFRDIVLQKNVRYKVIPACNKLLFIQVRLLRVLNRIKADYYVFLSFTSPMFFNKGKIINAIFDLTCWDCPESISAKMRSYYRLAYKIAAKRSRKIITCSEFSQKRICEKYNLNKNRVSVIYAGLTDIFKAAPHTDPELKQKYGLPDKYILSLSTLEPRKNLQLLIKVYSEMIEDGIQLPKLVLAGRQGWKLEEVFGNISDSIKEKIHFTGFIDDDDLAQVYREAELFVFPSKYEGFGLPVIEAMSQGTMVVTSDAASLPEVAGDAGIMFRSDDKTELRKALIKALSLSDDEKAVRQRAGRSISNSFVWEDEAEKLYNIINERRRTMPLKNRRTLMKEITVLLLTYNGERNAILSTVNSVIKQKNVNVKLIIADDGSEDFCKDEIVSFLEKESFSSYTIIDNKINRGTVLNVYNSLEYVQTDFVKLISQGDLLYDENSLCNMMRFMEKKKCDVAYGKMVGYLPSDLSLVEQYSPRDNTPYEKNDIRRSTKEFFLYLNGPCGALHMYRIAALKKYLAEIAGKVKYCEDNIMGLMMLDGIKMAYYPHFIIYYEVGNGISSGANKGQSRRIREDQIRCFDHFAEIRKCRLTQKAKRLYHINSIDNRRVRHILKVLLNPAALMYELKCRLNSPKNKKELDIASAKKDFLYKCIVKNSDMKS